jgi:hypothetical protein
MTPRRYTRWQFEMMESALAAGTTIALRSSEMMSDAATGNLPDRREGNLMVTEKAQAFSAGLFAAGLEYNRLWLKASMAGSLMPASTWLQMVRAASKPGHVTVRRNARRLTRRSR